MDNTSDVDHYEVMSALMWRIDKLKKMKVTDRKTGKQYDPEEEFERLMNEQWVKDIMKRLKERG